MIIIIKIKETSPNSEEYVSSERVFFIKRENLIPVNKKNGIKGQ